MERDRSIPQTKTVEVTPVDVTQAMTTEERFRIEATALHSPAVERTPRETSKKKTEFVEIGFEEVSSGVPATQSIAESKQSKPLGRTNAGHLRARTPDPAPAHKEAPPLQAEQDFTSEPLTELELDAAAKTEKMVLRTSLNRVLGNKLDLPIAFRLLERAHEEISDEYTALHTKAVQRITTELELVHHANIFGIEMPYTVAQLEKALEYLHDRKP